MNCYFCHTPSDVDYFWDSDSHFSLCSKHPGLEVTTYSKNGASITLELVVNNINMKYAVIFDLNNKKTEITQYVDHHYIGLLEFPEILPINCENVKEELLRIFQ